MERSVEKDVILQHFLCIFFTALGFWHMQSTYDRDDYVTVQWDNIQDGKGHNFNKYSAAEVTNFDTGYDYRSIMHYSPYGFSKNGKPTLVPKVIKDLIVIRRNKLCALVDGPKS